jgi:pimeloyl-ACP methyl ester carboxylesterase
MLALDRGFAFEGHAVAWGAIGAGPPLVLVHGTPFSAQVWRTIAPALAARHRVVFLDLLGYGASAKAGDVSLGVQGRLLAAFLDHLGGEPPAVLAHDFGGTTALRAWLLHGARYARLVLVDPVALSPWGSPFVRHVAEHEAAFAALPGARHRALLASYLAGAAHRPLHPAALEIHTAPWLGAEGQAAFYRQIAQMDRRFTDEIEPLLAPPPFPTTLLWGAEDAWLPLGQGRALAGRLTGGRLTVVPQAGHLVQEDAPGAILAALREGA